MEQNYEQLQESLVSIASELFRFKKVFEKAISKLPAEEQAKYLSQFAWFSKKVSKAMDNAELKIVSLEGEIFDPGMAVTPLNIDDFEATDKLFIQQMLEPIIMKDSKTYKMGTAILGRIE